MIDKVIAPFSQDQVRSINAYQRDGLYHPFTCGESHPLVATGMGLYCPEDGKFKQFWVHDFMADWSWLEQRRRVDGLLRPRD